MELIRTNQSLKLTVPPFPYQHCRYEEELNGILRYMFVPDNGTITLEVNNHYIFFYNLSEFKIDA